MDGEAAPERSEVSVACGWAALITEQQERQRSLYRRLRADVREVRELDDGYAFRHSPDAALLLTIAEFVANERLCCPLFEFALTVALDVDSASAHHSCGSRRTPRPPSRVLRTGSPNCLISDDNVRPPSRPRRPGGIPIRPSKGNAFSRHCWLRHGSRAL